jgi:hypothetical protein
MDKVVQKWKKVVNGGSNKVFFLAVILKKKALGLLTSRLVLKA